MPKVLIFMEEHDESVLPRPILEEADLVIADGKVVKDRYGIGDRVICISGINAEDRQ